MARPVSVEVSVSVPRNMNGAIALGRALVAAAEGEELPAAASEALVEVQVAYGALTELATRRHLEARPSDVRPVAEAHRAAWRALERWASAWLEGPMPAEERERASRILAAIGDRGPALQRLSHGDAWVEGDHRLARLGRLEADVEVLGGALFLRMVREAHRALGEAANVTTAAPLPLPLVREPLDALRRAVKLYALQVTAHGLRGVAAGELEARLLAPLEHLAPRRRRPRAQGSDAAQGARSSAPDAGGAAPLASGGSGDAEVRPGGPLGGEGGLG